ncbi:hypothetical protein FSP39_019492 [Pinctada imbricata]|uniref:Uncharacterized protein n=1 Tax=Pinctada imbricata TaxID=66713 RepID=A0AA89BL38_PINIB|nr:hypothetical protein FSP39_019492 [Pinctada imbricata]
MSAEWQHGLFGCFDNMTICLLSFFVPCYQVGKNAEAIGESCILCGIGSFFFIPLVILRGKIREAKGIQGSFIGDCCVYYWCGYCAIAQEGMEVQGMGPGGMGIARV